MMHAIYVSPELWMVMDCLVKSSGVIATDRAISSNFPSLLPHNSEPEFILKTFLNVSLMGFLISTTTESLADAVTSQEINTFGGTIWLTVQVFADKLCHYFKLFSRPITILSQADWLIGSCIKRK